MIGVGIANMAAAVIHFIQSCDDQFVLIRTGKKRTSMNFFNRHINANAFCLLSHEGKRMRIVDTQLGSLYDEVVQKMNTSFGRAPDSSSRICYQPGAMVMVYAKSVQGGT